MNSFVESCGKWLETVAVIVNVSNPLKIGIVLLEDSLSKSFLYFKDHSDNVLACFRIDFSIAAFSKITELELYFRNYSNYKIVLICPDLKMGDTLQSQITIASRIATDSTCPFSQENFLFLQKIGEVSTSVPTVDWVAPLFPLCSNQDALNTWIRRTEALNKCFYTKTINSQISFITMNIERRHPENDEDLSFLFEYRSPVICVVLEEVDIALQGQTPAILKTVWHAALIKAALSNGYKSNFSSLNEAIYIEIFVNNDYSQPVRVTDSTVVKIGGYSKFAQIITFSIGETTISFCGVKLETGKGEVKTRNNQLKTIVKELYSKNSDYLFICGDLSYHVELSYNDAITAIEQGNITKLLENDQLRKKSKLENYIEGNINFLPTYKYDQVGDKYDKYQVPSYVDRILCLKTEPSKAINCDKMVFETDIIRNIGSFNLPQESLFGTENGTINYPVPPIIIDYNPFMSITRSTHRPLRCVFQASIVTIDEEKKELFNKTRMERKDEMAALTIPQCAVETNSITLTGVENVSFINISCATAEWSTEYNSSIIEVRPKKGTLRPGDQQTIKVFQKIPRNTVLTINIQNGAKLTIDIIGKKKEKFIPTDI